MLIEAGDIKPICYELILRLRQYNNFSICQYSIKYHPWYLQDFIKVYLLHYYFFRWSGGGGWACGLDDVFPPDNIQFGSDAGSELFCK